MQVSHWGNAQTTCLLFFMIISMRFVKSIFSTRHTGIQSNIPFDDAKEQLFSDLVNSKKMVMFDKKAVYLPKCYAVEWISVSFYIYYQC